MYLIASNGLYKKHAVASWNLGTISGHSWKQGKPKNLCQDGWVLEPFRHNLISEILNALNNKNIIWDIICDLNCVNHDIFLSKLKFYGKTGTFYSPIKSYLEDRHQRVKLVNIDYRACSSWGIENMVCLKVQYLDHCCSYFVLMI